MSKSASKKQKTKLVDWTTLDKAENVNSFIDDIVDKPERFVDADSQIVESVLQNLKFLYDLSKELESQQMGPLKQLLIKGFDETQIWEEIQSQNRPLLKHLSENVNDICQQFKLEQSEFDLLTSAQLVKRKQDELKKINKQIEQKAKDMIASKKAQLRDADLDDSFDDLEDDDDENGENDDDLEEDEEDGENGNDETEDKFFKLDDMEKFVQQAEDEEMMRDDDDDKDINDLLLGSEEDDEEGLDNLENGEEDEEEGEDDEGFEDEELDEEDMELERALEKRARGLKEFVDEEDDLDEDELNNIQMDNEMDEDEDMEDDENEEEVDEDEKEAADEGFWNAGKKKKNAVESDDEEMSKPKKKTEFQQKQAKAKEKIRSIEKDLIAEKPWTLIGEASAADRPQNSLLEATLDFEYATKLAPVITEEYTNGIEELIRKRIAEQLFDDVLRKLPTENKSFKPSVELDMEKSKLGLAEVYEQEYLEKVMGAEKTDKLAEEHGEIDRLFFTVCKKLDALANFHFTPKRFEPEVKIKTNVPAIRLEEAVPVSVSESTTLAPREVYAPENDSLKNDNELTQEERKKNRKHKKEVKKKKNAGIEAAEKLKKKLNPASEGNAKREREQALKMIKEQRNITIASKDAAVTGGSTSLFKKLQEETDKKVSTVRGEKPKVQKKGPSKSSTSFKM